MVRLALRKRLLILASIMVGLAIISGITWTRYVEPKLTLFAPDKRAHNFAHMDAIFPSNKIAKSPAPLEFEKIESAIAETYVIDGVQRNRDEFIQRSQTTGLLIIKDGKIVSENYYKGNNKESTATSFSVAKSFVSTLVGIAIDEGLIDSVDDPITKYVPELDDSGFKGVRISHILQMSSGIDFSEDYGDEQSDAYKIFDRLFIYMQPLNRVAASYGSKGKAGSQFYYSSLNTQALTMLLRNVYKQDVSETLEQKIWHPMGMSHDGFWSTDLYGTELGFMSLNATARDFAKLGLIFLNKGKYRDRRIVSERWVEKALTPDKDYLQRGEIYGDWGYQYQWWLPRGSSNDFAAIGIWGQIIYVNPDANVVIVKTSSDENFKQHEFEAVQLFREIARKL